MVGKVLNCVTMGACSSNGSWMLRGGAKCVLRSVMLSCPFLIVLCLSRICLFRCPSVLNMVVLWRSLHGCSPVVVHC